MAALLVLLLLLAVPPTVFTTTDVTFIMINSTVQSEAYSAHYGVVIYGCCANVMLTNTSMRFANIHFGGFVLTCTNSNINTRIQMDSCQFIGSSGVPSIIYLFKVQANITCVVEEYAVCDVCLNFKQVNNGRNPRASYKLAAVHLYPCIDVTISTC